MNTDDKTIPVEIFAGTQWEAAMVKSLLENAEIEAFLKDDTMGTLNPWHASPGGVSPVKVLVSSKDLDRALEVVKKYEKNGKE